MTTPDLAALVADIRSRGFPKGDMDRIAREGTFEEVRELNLATGFVYPPLRSKFQWMFRAQLKAIQDAAAAKQNAK